MPLCRYIATYQASSSLNAARGDADHNKRAGKVAKRDTSPVEEEKAHVQRVFFNGQNVLTNEIGHRKRRGERAAPLRLHASVSV